MGKPENRITRAIRQVLSGLGIFHWKVMQGMGSTPGCPDIVGIWPPHLDEHTAGQFIGIEVKTPGGVLSKHQERFLDSIKRSGGIGIVCRDVDDVIDGLGIRKRFLF